MSNSIQIKRGPGRPDNKLLPYELGFDTTEGFLYIGGLLKEEGGLGPAIELKVHQAQTAQNALKAQSAEKLSTPRKIEVKLSEGNSVDFDGSADSTLGVSGILPVSKGGTGLQTLTSGSVLIGNGASVSFRSITDNQGNGHCGWVTKEGNGLNLITLNTLAYWNGQYKDSASNLAYCNKGAFGTIVTKNEGDYLPITGGMLKGGATITAPRKDDNSDNRRASFGYSGIQFHPYTTTTEAFGGFTYYKQDGTTESGKMGAITTKDGISYFYAQVSGTNLIKLTPGHGVVLAPLNYGTSDPTTANISGIEGQIYLQVIS